VISVMLFREGVIGILKKPLYLRLRTATRTMVLRERIEFENFPL
jgi:hypothetical protein